MARYVGTVTQTLTMTAGPYPANGLSGLRPQEMTMETKQTQDEPVKLTPNLAKLAEGVYVVKPRFPVRMREGGKTVMRVPTFGEVVAQGNLVPAGTVGADELVAYAYWPLKQGQASLGWTELPELFVKTHGRRQADPEALKLAARLDA